MSNPPTKRFKSSSTIFPPKMLFCPDCKETNKKKPSTCEMIYTFVCSCCFTTWKVCAICKEKKFTSKTFHKIDDHFFLKHNIRNRSPEITLDISKDEKERANIDNSNFNKPEFSCSIEPSMNSTMCTSSSILQEKPFNVQSIQGGFNSNSLEFFQNEFLNEFNGYRSLVFQAFKKSSNFASSNYSSSKETEYHMKMTHFLNKLPRTMHTDFISILNSSQERNLFESTRNPITLNDVDKIYLSGKNSIYTRLPVPTVSVMDDHAYVSLTTVIDHFLAMGISSYDVVSNDVESDSNKDEEDGLYHSSFAIEMRNRAIAANFHLQNILFLYLSIWSDDFEPTHYRKNKNSTWLKTVSISSTRKLRSQSLSTYILALGRKNLCHDSINEFYNKELSELGKVTFRYCGREKKLIPVVVKLLIISADRPERSALNYMLGHTGLYSKRWKYSALVSSKTLPSCPTCLKNLINNINDVYFHDIHNISCPRCSNWSYDHNNRFNKFEIPKDYPKTALSSSPPPPSLRPVNRTITHLVYMELSYDIMIRACKFSMYNFLYSKNWKKNNVRVYLKTCGISEKYIEENVIKKCLEMKLQEHFSVDDLQEISPKYPPFWELNINLHQCIDTPMHLLFQGITKTLIKSTMEWLKLHGLNAAYFRFLDDPILKMKSLQSSFCRIDAFSYGKEISTGGWIAENYGGVARCFCYVFGYMDLFIKHNESQEHKDQLYFFNFMIQSYQCMVSRLMSPSRSVSFSELDCHIKIFLSSVHWFDKICYPDMDSRNLLWYSNSNFLSLLNLPDQIERFGKIRNYYEGKDEKTIQYVKPLMQQNRSTGTFLQLQLERLYRNNVLQNQLSNSDKLKQGFNSFSKYNSLSEIRSMIKSRKPLSLVLYETESTCARVYCVIQQRVNKKTNKLFLHPVDFLPEENTGRHMCSLWYSKIDIEEKESFIFVSTLKRALLLQGIIALPLLSKDDDEYQAEDSLETNNSPLYTLFNDQWQYRNQYGQFKFSSISMNTSSYVLRRLSTI